MYIYLFSKKKEKKKKDSRITPVISGQMFGCLRDVLINELSAVSFSDKVDVADLDWMEMLGCLVEELQENPGEVRPSLGTKTACSTRG